MRTPQSDNPGVGKGTLLNSLVGQIKFKAGVSAGAGLTIELQRVEQGHTWVERQPWAPLSKWPQVTLMRAFYWRTQQRCRAFDQHPSS